jgi:nucleoid-associated protein YgaU
MGIFGRDKEKEDPQTAFSPARPAGTPAAPPAPSTPPPADQTAPVAAVPRYVVAKGDSLSKIAQRAYGDGSKWRKIYEANKDVIKDPDLIYPGQSLRIPE